ncbi:lipid A biosynthesis lauroyl acyltransferase [Azorhizobium oxalatiphilum]|nr:lipid A biosynthesis lauroyl acyltransferase [Azorhizobium oxalatiphilum]
MGTAKRIWRRVMRRMQPAFDTFVAGYVRVSIWWMRLFPASWSSNIIGNLGRWFGPWFLVSKVARCNLRAAFPEKSPREIEAIVAGCWENLARMAGEFAVLDRIWDYDPANPGKGTIELVGADIMARLRDDGRPALFFTAHTGNWELNAITGEKLGVRGGVLYRAPNNQKAAEVVLAMREKTMPGLIRAGRAAGRQMAQMLEDGQHLGMLVDQHWGQGVTVQFFGRPAATNPTLARLARQFDCPVHGMRVIRLPKNRFRIEITEEVHLPRDAEGKIDVQDAMQTVSSVIEDWVREYPEQWLWLHRRWR